MPAVYPHLHRIAALLREERNRHTLPATELVNELYLILAGQPKIDFEERPKFFRLAAHVMRLILRDRARCRKSQKRGSDPVRVSLSDDLRWVDGSAAIAEQ